MIGTPNVDIINMAPTGHPASAWHSGMTFDVQGGDGGDIILGSSTNSTSYTEQLRGFNGGDAISGADGADILLGGTGADLLYGNAGDDVLIGKAGADELYGSYGADLLCEEDKASFLSGEDSYNVSGLTYIYIAPGASGSFVSGSGGNTGSVYCGHYSYGSTMLDCDSTSIASPPGVCADFMP